jgi:hypothetical protein
MSSADDTWTMIEDAVTRVLTESDSRLADRLAELGWSEIEADDPVRARRLLFRVQGRTLACTDLLDRTMIAELETVLDGTADSVVMPTGGGILACTAARDDGHVDGVLLGATRGRVVIAVARPGSEVGIATAALSDLHVQSADTFDDGSAWTRVQGRLPHDSVPATEPWRRAVAAGRRALAEELVALGDAMLELAADHARTRTQFGVPIGALQAPRHALAGALAELEGARALVEEAWRCGGDVSAVVAKIAAGRAHRRVADVAMQVCAAMGLTIEHPLHRFVARGLQVDTLLGSYRRLEADLADTLFEDTDRALPHVVSIS